MKITDTETYRRYVAADHNPASPENRSFPTPQRFVEPAQQDNRPRGRELSWKQFNKHVGVTTWTAGGGRIAER
jgi:hypothetical protein